jgi:hypothetical protein
MVFDVLGGRRVDDLGTWAAKMKMLLCLENCRDTIENGLGDNPAAVDIEKEASC